MILLADCALYIHKSKFDTHACEYDIQESDFYSLGCGFLHAKWKFYTKCDFDMHECDFNTHKIDFHTECVVLKRMCVNITLTSVKKTCTTVIYTRSV
jgi:hypothetical protein